MFRHHLTVALRTLRRHKGATLLNVAGLAVGLACAALILGYVRTERSFDRFHANAERIYRVAQQQPGNAYLGSDRFAITPAGLGEALRNEAPEVALTTTLGEAGENLVRSDAARFVEEGLFADERFLRLFTFPLRRGDAASALREPYTAVLTETLARKLFGEADPVGQPVRLGGEHGGTPYRVTGVVADPPETSHLRFAYLLSLASDPRFARDRNEWGNSGWFTYLLLQPTASAAALEARLPALLRAHHTPEAGQTPPRLYLEPLTALHLHSDANFGAETGGDARLVTLFSAVALVILGLACANYTNLAVARSARRAREVGLRKASGATRGQIAGQHLAEALLTAGLALVLGLGLARLAAPAFSGWMARDVTTALFGDPAALGWMTLLAATLGLVAGAYPAVVLTAIQPVRALRGHDTLPGGRVRLRSVLVVGQYAAAVVLVIASLVIYRQMRFIQTRALGFDREHVVTFGTMDLDARRDGPGFQRELRALPGVTGVTFSLHLPTNVDARRMLDAWEGHPAGSGAKVPLFFTFVDEAFFSVYGMEIVAGRGFSDAFPADTAGAVVLNETAARALGWTTPEAVGKTLGEDASERVVGVVRDFHLHAMHEPIAPLVVRLTRGTVNQASVRVRPERMAETLAGIERAWGARSAYPFAYTFLDDEFGRLYRADRKLGEGVWAFTVIALFIACLGLFGLAAHAAERRTREVGIRKVLGASVPALVALLSRDFLKLVAVAFALAAPLAYLAADRWLEGFAYRVALGPGVFVAAGALALVVALLTVAGQAFRAATADPVRALRSE